VPLVQTLITLLYYALVAYVAAMLIWNLLRARRWQDELLYVVVLLPFLLRLFRLK
jgi:hypothetical protein